MENTTATIVQFIKALNISVTAESVEKELEIHPEFPSLLSVSDVLTGWNIPNAAYNVTFEDLSEIEGPFIISNALSEYTLVNHIDSNKATIYSIRGDKHEIPLDNLKQIYSGSVLIAEPNEESGEINYDEKIRKKLLDDLRVPFVVSGVLFILMTSLIMQTSYFHFLDWSITLLSFFKVIGLITSIILLMHSIDARNPFVQRLCTGMKSNCNAILASKAAKITEGFSWSEAGFFYFAGSFIVVLFNSSSVALIQILAVTNLLCLPYTFYSIYYQARIAKQWCLFCCTIQALFWLEFFVFSSYLYQPLQFPAASEWSSFVIGMSIPVLFWGFLKPYLLRSNQLTSLKSQLVKLKYDPQIFSTLLNKETQHQLIDSEHSIILGNLDAPNTITMISSPYCGPCAEAHKILDDWLDSRNDIRLQIIFAIPEVQETETKPISPIANHFICLKSQLDSLTLKAVISDWYSHKEKKDYKTWMDWSQKHPVAHVEKTQSLDLQKEWCTQTQINGTPAFFVNGKRLPKLYKPEDLKYFI